VATTTWKRTWIALPLLAGILLTGTPARATTMIGGEQLNPGEKAHEFYLGFPGLGYQWDFKADGKRTLGLQGDILLWPFTLHVGLSTRTLMGIVGQTVISFRFDPGLFIGFFGGSRGFYEDERWGRSKQLSLSMAPVFNLGVAASIDLEANFSLVLGFENPVALWLAFPSSTSDGGWWVEWPILVDVGLEYDISYRSTLFTKIAAGPVMGFAGDSQFAGGTFVFMFGMQTNYE